MYDRATHLEAEGRLREAIVLMQRVVAAWPAAVLWTRLGILRQEDGDPHGALLAYEEALRADPTHARTHDCIALVHLDRGQYDHAEPHLRQSLALREDAKTLVLLASVCSNLRRHEEARSHLNRSIELDPSNEDAWFNLAMLVESNDRQRAIDLLRQAVDLGSELAAKELSRLLREGPENGAR